jgi:hypothetical protein
MPRNGRGKSDPSYPGRAQIENCHRLTVAEQLGGTSMVPTYRGLHLTGVGSGGTAIRPFGAGVSLSSPDLSGGFGVICHVCVEQSRPSCPLTVKNPARASKKPTVNFLACPQIALPSFSLTQIILNIGWLAFGHTFSRLSLSRGTIPHPPKGLLRLNDIRTESDVQTYSGSDENWETASTRLHAL